MKLHHSTRVEANPDEVWEFLQDTRSVVACLPGAELTDEPVTTSTPAHC